MALISKSNFAARLGVTRARITHLIKRGLPTVDGKIDPDAAEDWMRRNLVPQARYGDRGISKIAGPPPAKAKPVKRGRPVAEVSGFDIAYEKAREIHFKANKAEQDFRERDGQLLDAEAVRREWESIIANSRGRVLACPSRIAARLPHLSLSDVATIRAEITAALMELGHGLDG